MNFRNFSIFFHLATGIMLCTALSAQGVLHPLDVAQDGAPAEFQAVIEIPIGESIKYEIAESSGRLEVDRFLSMPMAYPANYGAVPRALGGDGDPLDVLVLSRAPIAVGASVRVRPIGVLRLLDADEEDDKILAVPTDAVDVTWKDVREVEDLPEMERERLEAFFRVYKILPRSGKWIDILGWADSAAARATLNTALLRWRDDPKRLRRFLDRTVPRIMAEEGVPGLSIAVFRGEETLYARGFGVRHRGTSGAVHLNTVFEAASLSKTVVAYRALQLVDAGLLDLDVPLASYLTKPWTKLAGADKITPRMVLRHSSGLPNWRPKAFTDAPGELEFQFEPDSSWGYSGEGFMFLQAVLEEITGRPLDEDLRETVFAPLGMESSGFVWRPEYDSTAATGHTEAGLPRKKYQPSEAVAAAGLHTTALDWARFFRAVLEGAEPDEARLSEASRRLLLEPSFELEGELSWSLGWGLENPGSTDSDAAPLLWHWGDNWVFKALTFGDPSSGLGVVVLTNGETGLRAARPIIEAIFPGPHPAFASDLLGD